jgi:hypothetical protein
MASMSEPVNFQVLMPPKGVDLNAYWWLISGKKKTDDEKADGATVVGFDPGKPVQTVTITYEEITELYNDVKQRLRPVEPPAPPAPPLPKDVKRLWVAALLSGKYRQITGSTYDHRGYCALGLLMHVTGVCEERRLNQWLSPETRKNIIRMNDSMGLSFQKIAYWIEANL